SVLGWSRIRRHAHCLVRLSIASGWRVREGAVARPRTLDRDAPLYYTVNLQIKSNCHFKSFLTECFCDFGEPLSKVLSVSAFTLYGPDYIKKCQVLRFFSPPRSIARMSQARAVAQSRLTVVLETPRTSVISSMERPAKNRSSTIRLCWGS